MRRNLIAFALVFAGGCAGGSVPADWVAADRATYNAVADEHAAYVNNDPSLTVPQKTRRQSTLETWRLRIEEHEKAVQAGAR